MSTFEDLMRRKQRPLPKAGCSWAFYIFIILMALALFASYIYFRHI